MSVLLSYTLTGILLIYVLDAVEKLEAARWATPGPTLEEEPAPPPPKKPSAFHCEVDTGDHPPEITVQLVRHWGDGEPFYWKGREVFVSSLIDITTHDDRATRFWVTLTYVHPKVEYDWMSGCKVA